MSAHPCCSIAEIHGFPCPGEPPELASLRAENTRLAETLLEKLDLLRAVRTLCEERRDEAARNDASYWHNGAAWLAAEVLAKMEE